MTIRTLGQVRNVPNLKKNIISLSVLDSKICDFFGRGGGGFLKVCKGAHVVLEGQKRSQSYILQGRVNSRRVKQHMFSTIVDIQFSTILLGARKWSDLNNIAQCSLEDMDNIALPPSPVVPFYSIARGRPNPPSRVVDEIGCQIIESKMKNERITRKCWNRHKWHHDVTFRCPDTRDKILNRYIEPRPPCPTLYSALFFFVPSCFLHPELFFKSNNNF